MFQHKFIEWKKMRPECKTDLKKCLLNLKSYLDALHRRSIQTQMEPKNLKNVKTFNKSLICILGNP